MGGGWYHQDSLDVLDAVGADALCHKLHGALERGRLVVEEGLLQLHLKRKRKSSMYHMHDETPETDTMKQNPAKTWWSQDKILRESRKIYYRLLKGYYNTV